MVVQKSFVMIGACLGRRWWRRLLMLKHTKRWSPSCLKMDSSTEVALRCCGCLPTMCARPIHRLQMKYGNSFKNKDTDGVYKLHDCFYWLHFHLVTKADTVPSSEWYDSLEECWNKLWRVLTTPTVIPLDLKANHT